ncbi:ATP-binding protein [Streptomyces sp. 8N616]|uniref:ATP-binding protein n=1 Tax=Streptomyces sp. 8N616 TaxID=3457414 RepID=UPI003FD0420A
MASTTRRCVVCGSQVAAAAGRRGKGDRPTGGRPAKYCSNACRQRAFRARTAVVSAPVEPSEGEWQAERAEPEEPRTAPYGPPPGGELPGALDRFVGRAEELTGLRTLLRSSRLLTLIGPGGCGKSRLALELVGGSRSGRKGEARLVELDLLREGAGLPQYVAAVLGVAERDGAPESGVTESLVRALSVPGLLLVLDNCEHLAEECAELAALLLRRCPGLRIVATSREALRVPGEVVFRVGELTLPAAGGAPGDVAEALRSDAVRLFVERARACAPGFELTAGSADSAATAATAATPATSGTASTAGTAGHVDLVAEICRRLDGLPLAIELAARRVAGLPLGQILAGLDDQLGLLTDGSRVGPARHRELAAAIEWSHRLLDPAEQAVFRRVSVLVGGFDIAGARAVCAAGDIEPDAVLRLLCALEAKSLLVRVPGDGGRYASPPAPQDGSAYEGPHASAYGSPYGSPYAGAEGERARFRQLSPIRAYGLRRLEASGELYEVRKRALDWLADLTRPSTDMASVGVVPPELLAEQENLAAAVACTAVDAAVEADVSDASDASGGSRGSDVADASGGSDVADSGDRHLRLVVAMARVRREQDQLTACRELLTTALARVPRSRHRADALALAVRVACQQADCAEGLRLAEEAVRVARGNDDPAALADALDARAVALVCEREFGAAVAVYRECLKITRTLGRPLATAVCLHRLAWGLHHVGAVAEAQELMAECLPVLRELGTPQHRNAAGHTAGALHLAAGELAAAEEAFAEVLRQAPPDSFHAMYPVEGLAIVAAERGELRRALRLFAAAAAVRERIGMRPEAEWRRWVGATVERARRGLDASAAGTAEADGQLLRGRRLIAYALRELRPENGRQDGEAGACPLTERELQVAELVAEGLTNRRIGARLSLSPRTVATHLDHIRDKLGLRSRTKIALWVAARARTAGSAAGSAVGTTGSAAGGPARSAAPPSGRRPSAADGEVP